MKVEILKAENRQNCVRMYVEAKIKGKAVREWFKFSHEKVESGEYKDTLARYFEKIKDRLDNPPVVEAHSLQGTTIEV